MIRVHDDVGNVIETHEHTGDLKGVLSSLFPRAGRLLLGRIQYAVGRTPKPNIVI